MRTQHDGRRVCRAEKGSLPASKGMESYAGGPATACSIVPAECDPRTAFAHPQSSA
jgi:hypothetical protein